MKKEQIKILIKKYKYVFIGEIHGTKELPKVTFNIVKQIPKENKIIFCLELPRQVEKELYEYLNNKTNKEKLLTSKYLQDAIFDNRINNNVLLMYKKLYKIGIIFRCLENYDLENVESRDKEMAKRFLDIIKEEKADKYFIYAGNMHFLRKSTQILGYKINPIPIYLPKTVMDNALIIQFNIDKKENIQFYNKKKEINYDLILKEIKCNWLSAPQKSDK